MLNYLEIEVIQGQFLWTLEEFTDCQYSLMNVKVWAAGQLEYILSPPKARVNGETYNLRHPILIHVRWNEEKKDELIQVVLTKDRILRKQFDFPYTILNRQYLLISKSEFNKHQKIKAQKVNEPKAKTKPMDFIKAANAVEYSKLSPPKYGTPTLYTGMTN